MSSELQTLLTTKGAKEFAETLQGSPVSIEALLASIRTEDTISPEKIAWIRERINSSDKSWREMFVYATTGNTMLSPGVRINICPSERDVFEIHTCFNSIALPTALMSKEDFLIALDVVLAETNYNIG
ncbi:MAG: hypothetical protein K9M07_02160 [Simkaniaceae bacterium]|nr:hypothetical protein [Simkaniaceae bacterium]